MADWIHKTRNWNEQFQDDIDGVGKSVTDSYREGYLKFEKWLDMQCVGGWEVIKISRDFNHPKSTWCIFRKKG